MMRFYKYSASGNDFILFDLFETELEIEARLIRRLCQRKEGVGADGIILLSPSDKHDFEMKIYNADGTRAEMCGNAARTCVHYMHPRLIKDHYSFETMNGVYEGVVVLDNIIKVKMTELYDLGKINVADLSRKNSLYLNTGVPHCVLQVVSVEDVNVGALGKSIRHDPRFEQGSNVDFFEVLDAKRQEISLRIYERGVEDETLCCGTGVMASAIACSRFFGWEGEIRVRTKGGDLLALVDQELKNLYFQGPVDFIFQGDIEL